METNILPSETIKWNLQGLNNAIKEFPQVTPVTPDMKITHSGVSRMVMLDRYAFKDTAKKTLTIGDMVVLTVKPDPSYPARGIGIVQSLDWEKGQAMILLEEEYRGNLENEEERLTGLITRNIDSLDKPLEIYYEQIAHRNAIGLAEIESDKEKQQSSFQAFYDQLSTMNFVPAGRVLYGAGSKTDVTYFNCYVMPFVPDSREGIAEHRKEVMEIMSRGGGVGTNGSTLRPRNTLARGVNGKSSGSVSWLNDIAQLTHLVEQGGSRRGAQMIMLADWHPDIIEFIISKMQNPRILRYLIEQTKDELIQKLAQEKLKFVPLTPNEQIMHEQIAAYQKSENFGGFNADIIEHSKALLRDKGAYEVHNEDFLTGANISVTITSEFMEAVEKDQEWELRFPDVEHYNQEEMDAYNTQWHQVGDVRDWEAMGYAVRTYRSIPARELWKLINICATYSAEPGIFFIDNANNDTNAKAYGQKVVATNPCGEQPLAPYSVCNLAAINLANMANKEEQTIDFAKLKETVRVGVRMQDNVIDATPYFLEANRKQALGERRIGLGVMGLADLLIYTNQRYGSASGNQLIDKVFETIAVTAYETSIELAKEKGSFPFLIGSTDEETQKLRQNFISTGYMQKMPKHIHQGILDYGIRNSHLLTVAPTGSTGTMVGVATGLEPYFAFKYYRSGRLGKFIEVNAGIVQEYLDRHPEADADHLPEIFVSAMELKPEEHVDVQTTIQRWVDSSISKTVNAPKGYTVQQVEEIYERLYSGGAKGGTVYVDGSRDSQVLTLKAEENEKDQNIALFEVEEQEIRVVDEVDELRHLVDLAEKDHFTQSGHTDDVVYGSEVGDTCPICRKGIVEDIGGCNTCTNCNAQLRCGL
ncbi:vitamin B12-dependent ribonucleotide reductase [Facklamia miroungae]|uniref:Vitamin B12-dependent ribonucleotide reductase n=1 Tax=Facklamia miroungae TaxID=120956 RepID=A0A1G7SUX3_9LACT|nr:vitamin B12-dependent ribonucleotide reductase [Facklamia miroungae]NKZ29551.1 vitamin B12-dependent ribonucleotide reductase [Facklamia miroungae]SDG26090.1 ribonucleoside-diphosphate reductase alpha chain [Facklamia miroungae]